MDRGGLGIQPQLSHGCSVTLQWPFRLLRLSRCVCTARNIKLLWINEIWPALNFWKGGGSVRWYLCKVYCSAAMPRWWGWLLFSGDRIYGMVAVFLWSVWSLWLTPTLVWEQQPAVVHSNLWGSTWSWNRTWDLSAGSRTPLYHLHPWKRTWVSSAFPAGFPFFPFVVFLLFLRWRKTKRQFEYLLLTVIWPLPMNSAVKMLFLGKWTEMMAIFPRTAHFGISAGQCVSTGRMYLLEGMQTPRVGSRLETLHMRLTSAPALSDSRLWPRSFLVSFSSPADNSGLYQVLFRCTNCIEEKRGTFCTPVAVLVVNLIFLSFFEKWVLDFLRTVRET